MLAGANEVSAAAVGLVYLCAVGPSMLCKARSVHHACRHHASQQPRPSACCCLWRFLMPQVVCRRACRSWQPVWQAARRHEDCAMGSTHQQCARRSPSFFTPPSSGLPLPLAAHLTGSIWCGTRLACMQWRSSWLPATPQVGRLEMRGGGVGGLGVSGGQLQPEYRPKTRPAWGAGSRMSCPKVLQPPSPPDAPAVALSTSRGWQLLGVVFASLQGGLGEASCLAMTSYYRWGGVPACLTQTALLVMRSSCFGLVCTCRRCRMGAH